jgi:homoserine dehydrogenase
MKPYGIALIGCGTVGTGVARLLVEQGPRLAARAGRPLQLRRVVVRDPAKARDAVVPRDLVTADLQAVLTDPQVDVAVEVVGGVGWARQAVLDLLAAGKDVVTANKALLATHGAAVFDAARRHERAIAFEASVAGGIPIIAALKESLSANQILSVQGILNGTCNFILTGMGERGASYAEMLAEAQRLGYAEADPTFDVDGIDAAHKLAILVRLAFGVTVPLAAVAHRGIRNLQQMDLRYANELGYKIKLVAEAWQQEGQLALHVSPLLVKHMAPLAQVRNTYNAIHIVGDVVGDTLYYGKGAGQMPTASAVVADVIDMAVGRAQQTFRTLRLWEGDRSDLQLRPVETVRSRYYVRLLVQDRPGTLADVTRVLANHHISISSVVQHESSDEHEGDVVPLIIMTHTAATGVFSAAMAEMERLPSVAAPSAYYPVADYVVPRSGL